MSVLRQLVLNHMAITPSMECANIETQVNFLYSHFHQLMTALPQAAAGDISLESVSYLSAVGYSTEAEEKKGLGKRIWEGIKAIFAKIKAFLGRLLDIRKHRLKGNSFKIEKLKKYIQNIDMDKKPEGIWASVNTTLLPEEASHAVSAMPEFRKDAQHVMDFRAKALRTLAAVDLKGINVESAEAIIKGLQGHGTMLGKKPGSHTVFKNGEHALEYSADWESHGQSVKVAGASIITMNALVKAYEDLSADDAKYLGQIAADRSIADKFLAELDKLMEANSFRNIGGHEATVEEFEANSKRATSIWQGCRVLSIHMSKVERLTNALVFDILYSDIEEILRKSLGQYKFKKHELHEEDRNGGVDADERRYREEKARDKQHAEAHRQSHAFADQQNRDSQQAHQNHNNFHRGH